VKRLPGRSPRLGTSLWTDGVPRIKGCCQPAVEPCPERRASVVEGEILGDDADDRTQVLAGCVGAKWVVPFFKLIVPAKASSGQLPLVLSQIRERVPHSSMQSYTLLLVVSTNSPIACHQIDITFM
jgi:hypothetical protein